VTYFVIQASLKAHPRFLRSTGLSRQHARRRSFGQERVGAARMAASVSSQALFMLGAIFAPEAD
jgi:hypothetical protein